MALQEKIVLQSNWASFDAEKEGRFQALGRAYRSKLITSFPVKMY